MIFGETFTIEPSKAPAAQPLQFPKGSVLGVQYASISLCVVDAADHLRRIPVVQEINITIPIAVWNTLHTLIRVLKALLEWP